MAKVPYLTKLAKSLRFSSSMKLKKPRISKLLVKQTPQSVRVTYANSSNFLVDLDLFNDLSHCVSNTITVIPEVGNSADQQTPP